MDIVILTKSLMQSAGPAPLMYLMIALSVLSVAIILELMFKNGIGNLVIGVFRVPEKPAG